jgi:hypothetical protein
MRYYIVGQQFLTAVLSIIVIAVEALTLVKYRSTENVAGAWPTNPLLTPTYVLLAMAVLSCTADVITFSVNCCYGQVKNKMMDVVAKIRTSMGFLQAIANAAGAGYFRWAYTSSGTSDLWSWSCNGTPTTTQDVTNYGTLCNSNVGLTFYSYYPLANDNLLAGHSLGARNPTDHTSCAYSRHGTICSAQAGWKLQG